ncbi:ankyrin repeat domain-containing protein [Orientia tsutsugamushi]|uniref:Ankyrin repeat-containing protein 16 n=1 Tax=Orientia tsutsugamushi TaxID=784 RepID=A0A2U3RC77_ORITS|nr:ankyrin repeat domain-containing protein [Orientia tsutsugamushi]KJV85677.1 ankyrin repeat family protein [Orientia tsutsugamushi str. UT76]QES95805.1 ankyrin repeat domain-containing protein [Orientia tsutsugamushi]SPR10829.1 ankyrin repeat-containing protein 16 [Orientia tsutsugamushi]
MNNNDLLRELCNAAKNGNVESIKQLLAQDNAVNAINLQDNKGQTPLHFVTKHRFIKITASLNCKEYWSSHDNRDKGFVDVAKLLLNAGANPNIQDNGGQTPLHLAIKWHYLPASLVMTATDEVDIPCRSTDLINVLCESNCINFGLKNADGDTVLDLASFLESVSEQLSIVKYLTEKNILWRNPLVCAAQKFIHQQDKNDKNVSCKLPYPVTDKILRYLDDYTLGLFQKETNEEANNDNEAANDPTVIGDVPNL